MKVIPFSNRLENKHCTCIGKQTINGIKQPYCPCVMRRNTGFDGQQYIYEKIKINAH